MFIGSTTGGEGADQAAHMIDEIANPRPVLVGEQYEGTVVKTTDLRRVREPGPRPRRPGAHLEARARQAPVRASRRPCKEGDKLRVEVEDIDAQGKISLKPIGEEWDVPEGTGRRAAAASRPAMTAEAWRRRAGGRGGEERRASGGGGGRQAAGRGSATSVGGERTRHAVPPSNAEPRVTIDRGPSTRRASGS